MTELISMFQTHPNPTFATSNKATETGCTAQNHKAAASFLSHGEKCLESECATHDDFTQADTKESTKRTNKLSPRAACHGDWRKAHRALSTVGQEGPMSRQFGMSYAVVVSCCSVIDLKTANEYRTGMAMASLRGRSAGCIF